MKRHTQIRRDLQCRIYILNEPIHCYFDISSHLDRMTFKTTFLAQWYINFDNVNIQNTYEYQILLKYYIL